MTTTPATNTATAMDQIADCVGAIFKPQDIVRIIAYRGDEQVRQFWTEAGKIRDMAGLESLNEGGLNISFGPNPRKYVGGSRTEDVACARSLYIDIDDVTVDEALERIRRAGLPEPTITIKTRNGVHLYWVLAEPITDLLAWKALMLDLAAMLGADRKVCKVAFVLRLPGLMNWKEPPARIELIECDASRVYEWADLFSLIPRTTGDVIDDDEQSAPEYTDASLAVAVECLKHVADERADDYDWWIVAGAALHNIGKSSDAAMKTWIEFSKRSSKFRDGACEKKWTGFNPDAPRKVGLKRLLIWAMEDTGWTPPDDSASDNGAPHTGDGSPPPKKTGAFGPVPQVLDRNAPLDIARRFIRDQFSHPDHPTLIYQAGEFHVFGRTHYKINEIDAIKKRLYDWLDDFNVAKGKRVEKFKPNRHDIASVLDAMKTAYTPAQAPSWMIGGDAMPDASKVIVAPNGVFTLAGETLEKICGPTPRLYVTSALNYSLLLNAPPPILWLAFLKDIFSGDQQQIDLLQEWFGYCMTSDTSRQKALMLVGPKRSGKGTIAFILTHLIGEANRCAPTLAGLATNFGLASLVGKSLAIIGDARLSIRTDQAIVTERLLSITGEDAIDIDRKHRDPITTKLAIRFMLLSNELPRLSDASGALAGRFLILSVKKSYFGSEDHQLKEKLLPELQGIAWWAVQGLARLRDEDRFTEPAAADQLREEMSDLSSPVGAFVREWCVIQPGQQVVMAELFVAYCAWSDQQGNKNPGTQNVFGRDLRAIVPGIGVSQHRKEDGSRTRVYDGIGLKLAAAEIAKVWKSARDGTRS